MKNSDLEILILKNNFNGGHGAFVTFDDELEKSIKKLNIKVYAVNNVEDAVSIYRSHEISFSINIGAYNYYLNDEPLYNVFKIPNYEWIIDNPHKYVKYKLDHKSKLNRLIYIDKDFFKLKEFYRDDYLFIPFGGPLNDYENKDERIDAIFVPMDVRQTPENLLNKVCDGNLKNQIINFSESFDFDESFIDQCLKYILGNSINKPDEFILATNEYLRCLKRIKLINSIKKHEIFIASDFKNPYICGENIHYLPSGSFSTSLELQKKYKFVLNSTPNYDYCIHERISYSLSNGAIVISDKNKLLEELNFPGIISYNHIEKADEIIDELNRSSITVFKKQYDLIKDYKFIYAVEKIIDHYEEWKNKYEL